MTEGFIKTSRLRKQHALLESTTGLLQSYYKKAEKIPLLPTWYVIWHRSKKIHREVQP